MSDARFTAVDVERIAGEAVRDALARALTPAPAEPPPDADPYVDTKEAARRMGKKPKTIRAYLRLAPKGALAFAWKYGRDWRIHYVRLETWVRNDGPRLAAGEIGRMNARAIQ